MEEIFARIESLVNNLKEFVNAKLDSLKLSLAEKISRLAANLAAALIVMVMITLCIIFFSMALAYFLGGLVGNTWLGFLIVAFFYLLIAIIVWAARERILRIPIMNSILSQLSKTDEQDEED